MKLFVAHFFSPFQKKSMASHGLLSSPSPAPPPSTEPEQRLQPSLRERSYNAHLASSTVLAACSSVVQDLNGFMSTFFPDVNCKVLSIPAEARSGLMNFVTVSPPNGDKLLSTLNYRINELCSFESSVNIRGTSPVLSPVMWHAIGFKDHAQLWIWANNHERLPHVQQRCHFLNRCFQGESLQHHLRSAWWFCLGFTSATSAMVRHDPKLHPATNSHRAGALDADLGFSRINGPAFGFTLW